MDEQRKGRKGGIPGKEGYAIEYNLLGEPVYICKAQVGCTYKAKTLINARDHVNSKHFKVLIRCNKCPMAYLRFKAFQHHFVTKHQKLAYQCTFDSCNFKSYLADAMVEHYRDKHDSSDVPQEYLPIDPSIEPILCGSSECKDLRKKSSVDGGESDMKSDEKAYVLSQANVTKDMKGKPVSYGCKECGIEVNKLQNFVSHFKGRHQGDQQKCPMCDLQTVWPSYLRTHLIKVHKAKISTKKSSV